jgi:alginate O-acetyltransferase complex protein AlgI
MHQLEKKREFRGENVQIGLVRFLLGFFKKAFIADTLGVYLVDPVFENPGEYSSGLLWLAMLGYAVQIYADFSGYSSMAIGSARILGFTIPENFAFPYLSRNFSDFWRRWHMTMSRFFRDYVYIGLGGNRGGATRTMRNLLATTLLSGLWHGAGWTFVMWGGVHGICIISCHVWQKWLGKRESKPTAGFVHRLPAWFATQLAVCIAWILFRSTNFASAWTYFKGLIFARGSSSIEIPFLVWIAFCAFIIDHFSGWMTETERHIAVKRVIPAAVQGLMYAILIVFLSHARPADVNPFIYFQF